MAGDAADLVFTDPPYNVDYEGYTEEQLDDPKTTGCQTPTSSSSWKPLPVVPSRDQARRLAVRLPFLLLAARVSERAGGRGLRSPLPDHLGQEYLRLGLRPLQVPARADLLLPRRRAEGPLVRRQIAIHAVAGEQAGGESAASDHEASGAGRARAGEQQQGRRYRRGLCSAARAPR